MTPKLAQCLGETSLKATSRPARPPWLHRFTSAASGCSAPRSRPALSERATLKQQQQQQQQRPSHRPWRLCRPAQRGLLIAQSSSAASTGGNDSDPQASGGNAAASFQQQQQQQQQQVVVPWGLGTALCVLVVAWVGGGTAANWAADALSQALAPLLGLSGAQEAVAYATLLKTGHAALAAATLALWLGRYQPRRLGFFPLQSRPNRRWALALALGCALICAYHVASVGAGFHYAGGGLLRVLSGDRLAQGLDLLAVCAVGPATAVVLFWGFLLPSLSKYLPQWAALPLTAAAYSLAHFNIETFADRAFLGLIYGYAYEHTRSLWPPFLLHAFFSASTVLLGAL